MKGVRHDTGNKLGFLKAVVYFALRRPDLAGPFKAGTCARWTTTPDEGSRRRYFSASAVTTLVLWAPFVV